MAITRAQQAKQMLQEGGRIGFRIGSGDKDSKGRSYDTSGREYDVTVAESQVRDLDAIVEKLNTTFQQELKDEVEAENFFLN